MPSGHWKPASLPPDDEFWASSAAASASATWQPDRPSSAGPSAPSSLDHRGLDAAFETLRAAVSQHDPLATARATAAFKFHLGQHLLKEDRHLYVLFEQRLSAADQASAVGRLASAVPGDRFGDFVSWLFPLLEDHDRENVLAYWRSVMPPPFFDHSLRLVADALTRLDGPDSARPASPKRSST